MDGTNSKTNSSRKNSYLGVNRTPSDGNSMISPIGNHQLQNSDQTMDSQKLIKANSGIPGEELLESALMDEQVDQSS